MDYQNCRSLPEMFFTQAERLGGRPFLWAKRDGAYRPLTWGQVAEQVRALAGGLIELGLQPGDRVMLVSENRPEWLIADVAIMAAGGITVPAYTTNTPKDHLHIINDSGAKIVIVSTQALAGRVVAAAWQARERPVVVALEPPVLHQDAGVTILPWAQVMDSAEARRAEADTRRAEAQRDDTACIIYTSGTGGVPKGVMLAHGAILHNCMGAHDLLASIGLEHETFLSFLPLSHSYEHTAGQFFPISIGARIYYAEGMEHLGTNLTEVRPTIMTAVPRLYEVLRARINRGVARAGGRREKLFRDALALGTRRYYGERLSLKERLYDRLLERLVREKVRARFGGRLKVMVSGGAPLNYEVGLFFTALGVRVLQGYGQTESGPVVSVNPPQRVKLHTVGPPMRGVEVRIAEDGEILVRGELVMKGYWNNPEATAATIADGRWLHTGDIGQIDEDGYLQITDRKKDIIVNSGGDNISPQRVEGILTLQPEIAQAMAYGDRKPHLVALIVPDADWMRALAQRTGKPDDPGVLVEDEDVRKAVGTAVERVNAELSPIEKIRRFTLAPEPFTVENGMMTPTLKIRRHTIRDKYGAVLEGLYG